MTKKLILFFLFTVSVTLHAQKEASNWYFGDNSGIRFNPDGTTTALTDGQLSTDEGCTSISDANGDLLFYTDGINVFNKNHNIMQNGSGLLGSPSSTQSAIIIPKPLSPSVYYIFTVDTGSFDNTDFGFKYSEVDMSINNGLGAIIAKNIALLNDSSEKISAVLKDCQSQSIWVITLSSFNGIATSPNAFDTFHAFEVTNSGVNTTNVVKSRFPSLSISDQRGYLKFSPDGTKLACANPQNGLYLFDFDTDTGIVSTGTTNNQPMQIPINTSNGANRPYGVEFSPNNQLLYVSSSNDYFNQNDPGQNSNPSNHFSSLLQFNLTATNIQSSASIIDVSSGYRSALQLGPNGKIYRSTSQSYVGGLPFLSVINNPNIIGQGSNYVTNQVPLVNNSRQGLPPFITSFFNQQIDIIQNGTDLSVLPLCKDDTYTLLAEDINGATYTWTLDGNPITDSNTIPYDLEILVNVNGNYEVLIELNNGECEILEGEAFVNYSDFPIANPLTNITTCDANNDNTFLYDFTVKNSEVLGSQDPLLFSVTYFTTLDDANNNTNEITFPFLNSENPQEIFVRVDNNENTNCFDVNSFTLTVYNTPVISRLENIILCDTEGDITDGIITTDLQTLNSDILGTSQNSADYTITYHESLNDANNAINPLPNNYTNSPFTDQVFVRMVNSNNTNCVTIDSFTLTINLLPQANNASIFQCDEDGIPDGLTTYNLNELNDDVIGNDPNSNVVYYLNLADATSQTNAINADSYNNTTNPQFLVARVTNTTTQCFNFSDITLTASATSANDAILGICDTDGIEDGFVEFDLSLADNDVLFGLPSDLDLTYYLTLDEALTELNPLPNNYTNITAFNQTIFVRAENNNNCYGINEVELQVLGLPNIETEFETLYCLNTFPEKIVLTGGVIDDIPNNYYYDWSTGETTKEIEVNEPGVYTVTVRSVLGCTKKRTITVLASNTATITNIEVTDASQNNTLLS